MLRVLSIIGWAAAGAILTPLVCRAIAELPQQPASHGAGPLTSEQRRLLISLVLAGAFGLIAWRHGPSLVTPVLSIYAVVFVMIAAIDIDHHLILNRVLVPAALFALLVSPILPNFSLARALVGAAAGFLLLLLPAAIMPGGLGAGDVKLAGFLGLAAGFPDILTALAAGIILGGITTMALLITRRIGRRDFVPYGPFLLIGALLVFVRW